MTGVQYMDGPGGVADWLQIPRSKRDEIKQQYASVPDHKRAYINYFLTEHPAPQWKLVAISLWKSGELESLDVVCKLYFKGKPYEHVCC